MAYVQSHKGGSCMKHFICKAFFYSDLAFYLTTSKQCFQFSSVVEDRLPFFERYTANYKNL